MANVVLSFIKAAVGFRRSRSQWLYRKMHSHGIQGQNFDSPNHDRNGEIGAVRLLARQLLAQFSGEALVLFDIGANVGDYSKVLRVTFGDGPMIYCFEPSPTTFARLQDAVGQDNRTNAFQIGFGDQPGETVLHFNPGASDTSSLYLLPEGHILRGEQPQTITIDTVDSFCARNGIERIHFLKIDTEGHEYPVLSGAARMIADGKIDFIQFEFGCRQIDSRHFFRDFFQLLGPHYHLYRIVVDGLVALPHYDEHQEVFFGVSNYIAQRKQFGPALVR